MAGWSNEVSLRPKTRPKLWQAVDSQSVGLPPFHCLSAAFLSSFISVIFFMCLFVSLRFSLFLFVWHQVWVSPCLSASRALPSPFSCQWSRSWSDNESNGQQTRDPAGQQHNTIYSYLNILFTFRCSPDYQGFSRTHCLAPNAAKNGGRSTTMSWSSGIWRFKQYPATIQVWVCLRSYLQTSKNLVKQRACNMYNRCLWPDFLIHLHDMRATVPCLGWIAPRGYSHGSGRPVGGAGLQLYCSKQETCDSWDGLHAADYYASWKSWATKLRRKTQKKQQTQNVQGWYSAAISCDTYIYIYLCLTYIIYDSRGNSRVLPWSSQFLIHPDSSSQKMTPPEPLLTPRSG